MGFTLGDDGYILNEDTSKRYYFKGMGDLNDRVFQQVMAIPIINTTPGNTVLFRFSGQQEDIDITFAIYDSGDDMSNGTHTSTVVTIQEQIDYLKNEIFQEDYDINWSLHVDRVQTSGLNVVITDLQIPSGPGSSSVIIAKMSLKVGNIGNI